MRTLQKRPANIMSKTALLMLSLSLTTASWADDTDPPGRVARLGLVQGQVSIEPAGLDEWAAADSNRPVTGGDKIWADADARAELSIGSAVVRLGSATGFSFLNLDEHAAQMQVTAGTVSIHVRSMSDTLELDTPNVTVGLLGPGDYRVEVNDAGDSTVVKVSGGTAEVTGGGQDFSVHPQQLATFTGTSEVSEDVASLGAPDAFDRWAYDRDRQAQEAQALSYVSPDVVGAEDLDQNGTWESTPDDGSVWAPNTVAVGWAPYRFGHWIWVSPWGWSWVDDAPWGFAPFHYGRWTTFGGRWCWVPGPRRGNAVYAPALVAWVGGAPLGASASFAAGGVAWFPLGPREVYVPAYPASQTYIRNINISNTVVTGAYITEVYNHTVANLHYINRNAPGAITAVSQGAFTTAQSVSRNVVHLSANEIAAASISATAPAITPAAKSLLGAGASGPGIRRPPAVLLNRVVIAKTQPPPAPVPFALQQEAIRANAGRPLARSEVSAMQILAPAPHVRMAAPQAHAEPGTGMARAAGRVNPAPAIPAAPARRALIQAPGTGSRVPPPTPPTAPLQPETVMRSDWPPAAHGQPGVDNHAATEAAKPAAAVDQDLNRRVDRPAAPVRVVPAPPPASAPVAVAHPVAAPVVVETAPAPKPAPAAHAARPAPVEHWQGK